MIDQAAAPFRPKLRSVSFGELDALRRDGRLSDFGHGLLAGGVAAQRPPQEAAAAELLDPGLCALLDSVSHMISVDWIPESSTAASRTTFLTDGESGVFAEPEINGWALSEVLPSSFLVAALAMISSAEIKDDVDGFSTNFESTFGMPNILDADFAGEQSLEGDRFCVSRLTLNALSTDSIGLVGRPGAMYFPLADAPDRVVFTQLNLADAAHLLNSLIGPVRRPPEIPTASALTTSFAKRETGCVAPRPLETVQLKAVALDRLVLGGGEQQIDGWEAALANPEIVATISDRTAGRTTKLAISVDANHCVKWIFHSDEVLLSAYPSDAFPEVLMQVLEIELAMAQPSGHLEALGDDSISELAELSGRLGVSPEEVAVSTIRCLIARGEGIVEGVETEIIWVSGRPLASLNRTEEDLEISSAAPKLVHEQLIGDLLSPAET